MIMKKILELPYWLLLWLPAMYNQDNNDSINSPAPANTNNKAEITSEYKAQNGDVTFKDGKLLVMKITNGKKQMVKLNWIMAL